MVLGEVRRNIFLLTVVEGRGCLEERLAAAEDFFLHLLSPCLLPLATQHPTNTYIIVIYSHTVPNTVMSDLCSFEFLFLSMSKVVSEVMACFLTDKEGSKQRLWSAAISCEIR